MNLDIARLDIKITTRLISLCGKIPPAVNPVRTNIFISFSVTLTRF